MPDKNDDLKEKLRAARAFSNTQLTRDVESLMRGVFGQAIGSFSEDIKKIVEENKGELKIAGELSKFTKVFLERIAEEVSRKVAAAEPSVPPEPEPAKKPKAAKPSRKRRGK